MKVAEVKLSYKTKIKASERIQITSSETAYKVLKPYFDEEMEYKELFYVIYLNRANKVLGVHKISEGGCSGTVADGKIIFQGALLANAQAIILAHNHPSGNTKPSKQDIELTKKIAEFGKYIELPVLDHVILTEESFYSFADNGQI
jgi:DNA repair protein RadC